MSDWIEVCWCQHEQLEDRQVETEFSEISEHLLLSKLSEARELVEEECESSDSSVYCFSGVSTILSAGPERELPAWPIVDPSPVMTVKDLIRCFEDTTETPNPSQSQIALTLENHVEELKQTIKIDRADVDRELRRYQAMKRQSRVDEKACTVLSSKRRWGSISERSRSSTLSRPYTLHRPFRTIQ